MVQFPILILVFDVPLFFSLHFVTQILGYHIFVLAHMSLLPKIQFYDLQILARLLIAYSICFVTLLNHLNQLVLSLINVTPSDYVIRLLGNVSRFLPRLVGLLALVYSFQLLSHQLLWNSFLQPAIVSQQVHRFQDLLSLPFQILSNTLVTMLSYHSFLFR